MKRLPALSAKGFHFIAILLLIIAGTLVYSNTFRSPFVFDDINFITRNNPHVHMTELSWAAIKEAALEGSPRHRYLPNISFAVNYYFGRENPFGYHLVNLGIHLLTGIFLFFLFKTTLFLCSAGKDGEMSKDRASSGISGFVSNEWAAFFGAMLWLVHPVQTNAVTYMCQRMTSMAALFFVLSLLLYAAGRKVFRKGRLQASVVFFSGCLISGLCAVASKENAGTLPIFILLYEWFFFQNLKGLRSVRPLVWVVVGAIVFICVSVHFLGMDPIARILASYSRRDFTLPERVMTEFRVVVYYFSLLVFPHPRRLILDHDYPISNSLITPISTIFSLGAIIGLTIAAVYAAKKDRLASFGIIWFLGNLVIESSVSGIEIIYEHRMVLPAMFLYPAFSQMVFRVSGNKRRAGAAILTLLTLTLGTWAHQRNVIWQTEESFWTDNVQKAPGKARPYQNLAYSLQAKGEYVQAIANYRKSLAIAPHPTAYANMGLCFESIGYYSDAVEAYARALKMKPDAPNIHCDLAAALTYIGEFDAAMSHFVEAARLDPKNPGPEMSLGVLRMFLDQCREPEACIRMSIRQKPDNAELQFKLGMIYEKQGRPDEAMAVYETVRRMIGETDRKLYERVVIRLAFLYAVNGDMEQTRRLLDQGIKTAPDNPNFYYEMAALNASLSQTEMAVAWLDKAIQKGFHRWDQLESDQRLESLRSTRYYRNLKRSD
ncbi:MAG: tetratricopeptide repeat protein [Desulfosalsimonadaceae bacterium]|nr:tetratricopeptide repeat protein [Desulfosalsimonadaceae bacterium]